MGYPPDALSDILVDLPDWIKLGCGNEEYICPETNATFPGDICPDALPDLSKHNSILAEYLREHPEVYDKYKGLKTSLGVGLAKCIKTGIDNPGHPHIKTCGLVAGDEECYELFKDIFNHVISVRHRGYPAYAKHSMEMDVSKLSDTKIDPTGKYVTIVQFCIWW